MFWHSFKYRIKSLLRVKVVVFWSFIYPILLATLFYLAFGSQIGQGTSFETIDISVVKNVDNEINNEYEEIAKEVTYSDDKLMFNVSEDSYEEAERKLKSGEITAIVCLDDEINLVVSGSGISQSIVKQYTDVFLRNIELIKNAVEIDYTKVDLITSVMEETGSYIESVSIGGEKVDSNIQFYYGLIAMTCLFGCFVGITVGTDFQANASAKGARKMISGTNRLGMLLADLSAAVAIDYSGIILVFLYIRYVQGIPIGREMGYTFLILFLGCLVGVELGQFVSCVAKENEGMKVGLSLSFSLASSALSGLMSSDLKWAIDEYAPIVSRINPGTVIADCFYCLAVYSDYSRLWSCLIILTVEAVLLVSGCFLAIRRCKYVSI